MLQWETIITNNPSNQSLYVSIYIRTLPEGILGQAASTQVKVIDQNEGLKFGNIFSTTGILILNDFYLSNLKTTYKTDGNSNYYYIKYIYY